MLLFLYIELSHAKILGLISQGNHATRVQCFLLATKICVGALCVLSLRCDGEFVLILPGQLSLSQGTFLLLSLIDRVLEDLSCVPKCMVPACLLSMSMELVNSGIINKHNLLRLGSRLGLPVLRHGQLL